MPEYKVDFTKHNARNANEKATDIMTECFHGKVTSGRTAKILFAAGYTKTGISVQAFFDGRQKWLDSRTKASSDADIAIKRAEAVAWLEANPA